MSYCDDLRVYYSRELSEKEYKNNLLQNNLISKEKYTEANNKQIEHEKKEENEYLLNTKKIDNDFKKQLSQIELEKYSNEKKNDIEIKEINQKKIFNNYQFEENKKKLENENEINIQKQKLEQENKLSKIQNETDIIQMNHKLENFKLNTKLNKDLEQMNTQQMMNMLRLMRANIENNNNKIVK